MTIPFLALFFVGQLHVAQPVFALFLVVNTVGGVLINQALGRASDRRGGYRAAALWPALPSVVGYALFALLRTPTVLLVLGSLFLSVNAAVFSQLFALLRRTVAGTPGQRRLNPVTLARSLFSLGWVVGPAVASVAVARAGFPALFLSAAGMFLLVVLAVQRVRDPAIPQRAAARPEAPPTLRPFAPICAAYMTVTAATSLGTISLPLLATTSIGASVPQTGLAFSIGALLEIPLILAFGSLGTRWPRATLLSLGMGLYLVYFLLLSGAHSIQAVYVAQAVGAVPTALLLGTGMLYFQELAPQHPGFSTALYSNITKLGTVVGQLLFGGLTLIASYRQVFVLAGILSLLGAIWFTLVTRKAVIPTAP